MSIGQAAELSFINDEGLLKAENGVIAINQETQETDMPGIFACGDAGKGLGAIIDAIAAGRRAAISIDKFLDGDSNMDETLARVPDSYSYTGERERGFAELARAETP